MLKIVEPIRNANRENINVISFIELDIFTPLSILYIYGVRLLSPITYLMPEASSQRPEA